MGWLHEPPPAQTDLVCTFVHGPKRIWSPRRRRRKLSSSSTWRPRRSALVCFVGCFLPPVVQCGEGLAEAQAGSLSTGASGELLLTAASSADKGGTRTTDPDGDQRADPDGDQSGIGNKFPMGSNGAGRVDHIRDRRSEALDLHDLVSLLQNADWSTLADRWRRSYPLWSRGSPLYPRSWWPGSLSLGRRQATDPAQRGIVPQMVDDGASPSGGRWSTHLPQGASPSGGRWSMMHSISRYANGFSAICTVWE